MTMPQGKSRIPQQYRSMTSLSYTTAEGSSINESPMVVGNGDDKKVGRTLDSWLPIVDGRSRLLPVDVMASETPSESIPEDAHRLTTQADDKSQPVWQPLKLRRGEETTANGFAIWRVSVSSDRSSVTPNEVVHVLLIFWGSSGGMGAFGFQMDVKLTHFSQWNAHFVFHTVYHRFICTLILTTLNFCTEDTFGLEGFVPTAEQLYATY
eukprot:TsM_000729800 transcript=TsM_000729800 gene=TsM_000729800